VADAGGRGRDDGSEGLVGIELRRPLVGHELLAPGLLHLRPVGGPQRLAQGLKAFGVNAGQDPTLFAGEVADLILS